MAHKGAYLTNLHEFLNSSHQRYHHKRYVQQLQHLLTLHQRNRRCLPDPAQGIHSKRAKQPLPTSPCFQQQQPQPQQRPFPNCTQSDPNRLSIANHRPVSPGRSILSSPRSRSRSSSRAALAGSALSQYNLITCFSTSPIPQPSKPDLNIPTVIVTSEGNQQLCPYPTAGPAMAPSSVQPMNRSTNPAPATTGVQLQPAVAGGPATAAAATAANPAGHHLRKVTFKLPQDSANHHNGTLPPAHHQQHHQRTSGARSAPPLYRSVSESSLINCSTISDEQNEMPIQLRNQRNLPQKPLNKAPMSPTIPIAKLRLLKELNLKENHQVNSLTRNSTMYNLNTMNNYGNAWSQRNAIYDPRYGSQLNQFGQPTGLSRYSHSLPNSPSKRPMHNYYNQHLTQQLNHQMTPRHLSSIPNYQPVDCYTVGANGVLSAHGPRFPLGTLPPLSSTSPHSPQTNLSLPSYSQITRPSFLDGQYSHRTGLYTNPLLYDKQLQRLKQRIPVCKSAPLSSIVANSLPTTNQFNTHDAVTGLPRRRHTTASALTKSSLSPKTVNLGTGHRNPSTLLDGTIEQEDSPLTAMRKEIKYFVDERKRQLEQGALDSLTVPNTIGSKYLGSGSNLSNSTALYNDQSPLSGSHLHTSPNLASTLAQNRYNYLSSSESDLNALLHMYSYPPDPVLDRQVPAGASVYQRLPQYYLNRAKHRYTVDDLRRHRNPLLDYYDESLYNQYANGQYYDPLLDRSLLPNSTYSSLVDWPTAGYGSYNRPGYYASTGCLRQLQTPTLTNLNALNSAGLGYNRGLITGANRNLYDQDLLLSDNYLPGDYHHYSLDTLGLDHRTSYSRPNSPYYGTSAIAPLPDYTQHSLSTNHLDSVDLNNNLLSKPLGQTASSLPLRSYRI